MTPKSASPREWPGGQEVSVGAMTVSFSAESYSSVRRCRKDALEAACQGLARG